MNQMRMQLDTESRNLAAATDDNIHLKAQVEALHSKNINLEAKVFLTMLTTESQSGGWVAAPIAGKSWKSNHEPLCSMREKHAAVTLV